ncbi:MAG TPA: hypothetical protein VK206_09990, partial [Anaerolineales bacterium]|nr:hypothetical protein [Anaerolineales bacterium]
LLITLFLRRRGWNVVFLGAVVPTERIEETLSIVRPQLVILSAQTLMTALSLRDMARLLNQKDIQAAFGGRVFNHISGLASRIPAHFLGNTLEVAIPMVENLITNPTPAPKEETTNKKLSQIAMEYKEKLPMIEQEVSDYLQSHKQQIDFLDTANQFLGNTLSAALELGDISYTATDIDWLTNLLIERNISSSMLPLFLNLYAQAVRNVMGEDGQIIYDWLTMESQRLNV